MNVKTNHYNKKKKIGKHKINLDKYKTECKELNIKIDKYENDVNNGFDFFKPSILEKFIIGHEEISDFSEQFIKLYEYNITNNKYTNSLDKFIINYGKTIGSKKFNEKCERVKGKNNPAYQHGGRLSPLSDKFIHKKTDEEKEDIKKKIAFSNKNNGNNTTTLKYWTKQGYSKEEAKQKVSERQKTFSLDICIEKYGIEKGTEVFNERQIKWQETLNSKPQEEIDKINMLKGTGSGAGFVQQRIKHQLGFAEKECTLYYVKLKNENVWKIGVTSQTLNTRFGRKIEYDVIHLRKGMYKDMFLEEQRILKKFKKYRIKYQSDNFSSYECFNTNILFKQGNL